jgi:hypothetical protein
MGNKAFTLQPAFTLIFNFNTEMRENPPNHQPKAIELQLNAPPAPLLR